MIGILVWDCFTDRYRLGPIGIIRKLENGWDDEEDGNPLVGKKAGDKRKTCTAKKTPNKKRRTK